MFVNDCLRTCRRTNTTREAGQLKAVVGLLVASLAGFQKRP
jgi:hypothetical protein